MRELEISRRAFAAGDAAYFNTPDDEDAIKAAVKAAARLVVATELRRLAHKWTGDAQRPDPPASTPLQARLRTWFQAADELRDRADELDPQGGAQ